ncbi:hypothetical protein [Brasilonema sp. UFV-L1]|uniref:hypothetical protein n=1 Tax=Brasilonema sp. UFV-L1 TaxID=2234130 RepID=UPI002006E524|nr:hypothetical protein [Brasilonema sp. UFV-L1]
MRKPYRYIQYAEECELGMVMISLHQFKTEHRLLSSGQSEGLGAVGLVVKD